MAHLLNYGRLLYWVQERDAVRKKKEMGMPKPWSNDMVFRTTYFCNVRREDDRVTKFIRKMYSHHVNHPLFVHNIILSRFLNWPPTLEHIGYQYSWDSLFVKNTLNREKRHGKVWGNAYVVTTHGIPMDKIDYLCYRVMPSIDSVLRPTPMWGDCKTAAYALQFIEGIGTFMAGQIVADLKNTPGHPLQDANDWWDFALPGPGSVRGMDWVCGERVPSREWHPMLLTIRDQLDVDAGVGDLCAQDVQNCLCEYDKWERVINGTGRSKRGYDAR